MRLDDLVFTQPRVALLRWLIHPTRELSAVVAGRLLGQSFEAPLTVIAAVMNGFLLNVTALCLRGGRVFAVFIAADAGILVIRLALARRMHRGSADLESGRDRQGGLTGVPYGSIARLILLYLQTEATRTGNPEVELGRSMKSWMGRMNLTSGGKTYQLVTEQARRISACRLTFFTARESGAETRHNGAFVQDAITFANVIEDDDQPSLWQDRVRLDPGFWRSLREHPVPVREEAIRAIGTRSLAIDVYIWLAYRLHSLNKPTPVSWTAIHGQFGAGFRLVRQIKPTFTEALALALAVYPEAQVDIEPSGIVLHPSPPAVAKADARRMGIA